MCVPHHYNSSILVFFRLNERDGEHGHVIEPRRCDALFVTILQVSKFTKWGCSKLEMLKGNCKLQCNS
jgi:hypothetical protein